LDSLRVCPEAKAVTDYQENRNIPSIHERIGEAFIFIAGTLSVKTKIKLAAQRDRDNLKLSGSDKGISC
jgi:hypothetical protein